MTKNKPSKTRGKALLEESRTYINNCINDKKLYVSYTVFHRLDKYKIQTLKPMCSILNQFENDYSHTNNTYLTFDFSSWFKGLTAIIHSGDYPLKTKDISWSDVVGAYVCYHNKVTQYLTEYKKGDDDYKNHLRFLKSMMHYKDVWNASESDMSIIISAINNGGIDHD